MYLQYISLSKFCFQKVNGFFSLTGQVYFWACRLVFIHVDVSYLINSGSVSLPPKNNIHKILGVVQEYQNLMVIVKDFLHTSQLTLFPKEGEGYTDLPLCASLSACPQQFFDAFFSETITRNMLEILKACLMMGFISQ